MCVFSLPWSYTDLSLLRLMWSYVCIFITAVSGHMYVSSSDWRWVMWMCVCISYHGSDVPVADIEGHSPHRVSRVQYHPSGRFLGTCWSVCGVMCSACVLCGVGLCVVFVCCVVLGHMHINVYSSVYISVHRSVYSSVYEGVYSCVHGSVYSGVFCHMPFIWT